MTKNREGADAAALKMRNDLLRTLKTALGGEFNRNGMTIRDVAARIGMSEVQARRVMMYPEYLTLGNTSLLAYGMGYRLKVEVRDKHTGEKF